jgi:putative ABC transport system ATP-binding protein
MIHLSNIRFAWHKGNPPVLDIPAFDVADGERVFLAGPSGSGKTTLLSLLGGVVVPESGAVRIMGTDIVGLSGAARDTFRADHIGFIFQMFNLVPYLSALENVMLACRFSPHRRRRILERSSTMHAEASRLLGRMGLDIDMLADRPAARLSTGQQQRVAAARALIGMPNLIVADEPTSSLDEDVRQSFLDLLFQEVEITKATVLFVSHDARLTPSFTRVVALRDINRAGAQGAS